MVQRRKQHERRKPVEIDRLVGENVRALRRAQARTLAETAEALGISHQQLQKYEIGTNRISAGILLSLAHYFGVPIEALFERPDAGNISPRDEISLARRKCHLIVDRTTSLSALTSMARVLRALPAD